MTKDEFQEILTEKEDAFGNGGETTAA